MVSFSAVARVQKTAPLNFCNPPDQSGAEVQTIRSMANRSHKNGLRYLPEKSLAFDQ